MKPWRRDLVVMAALLTFLLACFGLWLADADVQESRAGCERNTIRSEVLYDFIGMAQDGWRAIRDDPTVPAHVSANASAVVEDYVTLRVTLRDAVADHPISPGTDISFDCDAVFPRPFPLNLVD